MENSHVGRARDEPIRGLGAPLNFSSQPYNLTAVLRQALACLKD
jgi:hypothetical protein